jgi:hypothetical protein
MNLLRGPSAALDFGSDRSRTLQYAHGHSQKPALHSRRLGAGMHPCRVRRERNPACDGERMPGLWADFQIAPGAQIAVFFVQNRTKSVLS